MMIDLDFMSYADVHRKVIETIPAIRQFPISAVTYVPRGGSAIAAIVCQIVTTQDSLARRLLASMGGQ